MSNNVIGTVYHLMLLPLPRMEVYSEYQPIRQAKLDFPAGGNIVKKPNPCIGHHPKKRLQIRRASGCIS